MNYKRQIIVLFLTISICTANYAMQSLTNILSLCKITDQSSRSRIRSHLEDIPEEIKEHMSPHYLQHLPYRTDQIILNRHSLLCALCCYGCAACNAMRN